MSIPGQAAKSAFGAKLSAGNSSQALRIGRGPWISEAEIDDKLDQFNQQLVFLDIKKWNEMTEEKKAAGKETAQL